MDIIAVQAANKVLKKMNTEYNGLYDKFVATAGQTEFTTSKAVDTTGHTLKVYVDGVLAIKDVDYTQPDSTHVVFNTGIESGLEVLLTTEVVGIPTYQVVYDDTAVKSDISSLQTRTQNAENAIGTLQSDNTTNKTNITNMGTDIANIKTALDADSDGSIVDTIADIKAQWEAADGSLQTLIGGKADQTALDSTNGAVSTANSNISTLQTDVGNLQTAQGSLSTEISTARNGKANLSEELTSIKNSIPAAYDDSTLAQRVTDVETEVSTARDGEISLAAKMDKLEAAIPAAYDDSALKSRVQTLEDKTLDSFTINDTVTGWAYKIQVTNGSLVADLLKKLQGVILSRVGSGTIYKGDTANFTATSTYTDTTDATADTTFVFSVNDTNIATIDSVTGILTTITEGSVTVIVEGTNKNISKTAQLVITIELTDAQIVVKAKTNLDVATASGLADLTAVTGDLTLPATQDGATVTWASDNEAVISTAGVVTRPASGSGNATVNLTATITKNAASDTKVFVVTVVALP